MTDLPDAGRPAPAGGFSHVQTAVTDRKYEPDSKGPIGDLLDTYDLSDTFDEMFAIPGRAREHYRALHGALQTLSRPDFEERCSARDHAFRDQGITFSFSGEERPFPLDLVPRVLGGGEWRTIEAGVRQRVRTLEAFLADVYGPAEILEAGVLPRTLVMTSSHYHRSVWGVTPTNGVRVHVAGIDLVRGADGRFRVLEDNLRTPSGVSYVVENRTAMTHVFPELFASHRVRQVSDYPARLLEALRASAPVAGEPTVVVLTPGVHNAAYFEHSFLARRMGVELVEGRDLVCHGNRVFMRTTAGERRVDVVYRRIDDEFLDPLQFRPDSILGCPGIVNAARAGNVTIANAAGNGVADDKAIYPYVPAMVRYYLGEEPILPNVDTYRLELADEREWALARLDRLVFKPVDGSGGYGIVIGPQATEETLDELQRKIVADPRGWIAQEPVALSTSPTYTSEGMRARHVDLRPFAVNDGTDVWVLPGGLTRVALPEGSLIVNSSQGGGSKDTWVLADESDRTTRFVADAAPEGPRPRSIIASASARPPDDAPQSMQAAQQ